MSELNKTVEPDVPAFVKKAPELLPVWDWWVKEGKSTVLWLVAAALAVGAFYGGRGWLRARDAKANAALAGAYTTEDFEAAVASYGSTKVGPALKLRLAKSYYDAERYEDALNTYDALAGKNLADGAFDDLVTIGRAYALEGLKKYADANKAFAGFVADPAKKDSYLILTARMGAARTKALAGDKDGAIKDLEALKKEKSSDKVVENRVDRLIDMVKRYDPSRKPVSLFDAANAAEKSIKLEKAATKPVVPKAPAAAPKAPAAKPAAK